MYSIYLAVTRDVWQARHVTAAFGDARVVNLVEAVRAVRCDGNHERRKSRQRHTAMKLAAGAVLLRRAGNAATAQRYEQALRDLTVPDTLVERLSASPATSFAALEGEAGVVIDTQSSLCAFQRTCCPCISECTAGAAGGTAGVEFEITIQRDPKHLSCAIDPQTWPTIAPGYFKKVFVLENAPPCVGDSAVCRNAQGPCPPDVNKPIEDLSPPPRGSTWCGLFDEQFESQAGNVSAKFENILRIGLTFTPDDSATSEDETSTQMLYGLCEAVSRDINGQTGACGLEEDCGEASIEATGVAGWSRFRGSKLLRFAADVPEDPNAWAPIALELLVQESAASTCRARCSDVELGDEEPCTCGTMDRCFQSELPYKPPTTKYCQP